MRAGPAGKVSEIFLQRSTQITGVFFSDGIKKNHKSYGLVKIKGPLQLSRRKNWGVICLSSYFKLGWLATNHIRNPALFQLALLGLRIYNIRCRTSSYLLQKKLTKNKSPDVWNSNMQKRDSLNSHSASCRRSEPAARPPLFDFHKPLVVLGVVDGQIGIWPPHQHHASIPIRPHVL